jgi:adenylate cyclase
MGVTMTEERVRRKLSGILSADAVGYSRLMQKDEEATIRALADSKELMADLIQQYRGRVVDAPGDNLLAEFGSVVDAADCAVKIQQELKIKNENLPQNRKMEFRIGVNLGDVVEEAGRIYGDGVNIAARLERLAAPGGICISGIAFDQVKNKLKLGYEDLGAHSVKNIAEPVQVYKVLLEPEYAGKVIGEAKPEASKWRLAAIGALALIILAAGAFIVWNNYVRPQLEPVSLDKMAQPLPGKPSIAVLAFDNLSGDPEQAYFSDGVSEEIITALSKTPKLFVIARTSSFKYKGKRVDIRTVGRELGVRYVLEGSVRRAGDKVRITAQLIDAITEKHLWAERYDRNLREIFAIQDEITLAIIKAMQVVLTKGEMADLTGRGTKNLDAYLKALQAQEQWRRMDKEGTLKAKQLALEAIAIDRQYAYPYAIVSWSHMMDVWLQASESPKESMRLAVEAIQKALTLDEFDYRIHIILSNLYIMQGKNDEAIASAQWALKLCPGSAFAHAALGTALRYACRFDESVQYREQAIKLDPFPIALEYANLALAYSRAGRYDDAIAEYKKALAANPNDWAVHFGMAVAYARLNRKMEARIAAKELQRIRPDFSLDWLAETTVPMYAKECRSKINDEIEFLRKADVGLK